MQVSPSVVAVMKTKNPKNPEKKIVIAVKKIKIVIDIFA